MKKIYMDKLKKEHNAWLVWGVTEDEEIGLLDHYYIFTDTTVLENYHANDTESYAEIKEDEIANVRQTTVLYMEYVKLNQLKERLDEERKIRLEKLIKDMDLENKYNNFQNIMTERAGSGDYNAAKSELHVAEKEMKRRNL